MRPFHGRTLGLLVAGVLMLSSAASGGPWHGNPHGNCCRRPLPVYRLQRSCCPCQHAVQEWDPVTTPTCSWNRQGHAHAWGHSGCGCGHCGPGPDMPAPLPAFDNGSPSDKRPGKVWIPTPPDFVAPPETSGLGFKAREEGQPRRPFERYPVLRRGKKSEDSALPPYMAPAK